METRPLSFYKTKISKATTKEELNAISYDALKNDDKSTVFSKKYDKIVELCTLRQMELEEV